MGLRLRGIWSWVAPYLTTSLPLFFSSKTPNQESPPPSPPSTIPLFVSLSSPPHHILPNSSKIPWQQPHAHCPGNSILRSISNVCSTLIVRISVLLDSLSIAPSMTLWSGDVLFAGVRGKWLKNSADNSVQTDWIVCRYFDFAPPSK